VAQNSALTVYHNELSALVNIDFDINVLDGTCSFSEGPVWNSRGYYLFSDIPANVICKIAPHIRKEVFLMKSGCDQRSDILSEQIGSNGLAYGADGTLYICQHGDGAVAKWSDHKAQPFLTTYNGQRFNSPNDIVVHPDGSIFFSDPPYGLKDQQLVPLKCQPLAGIYCYREGKTTLVSKKYQYPNGLCLSPDGSNLYCCSNKPAERFVLVLDAKTLVQKEVLCQENSDGIKCDRQGNLWLCTKEGIVILNSRGVRLGNIKLPTIPSNCCWGGEQGNDLFITARENIFLIKNLYKGS
jgi:gluconolactonase